MFFNTLPVQAAAEHGSRFSWRGLKSTCNDCASHTNGSQAQTVQQYCTVAQSFARMDQAMSTNLHSIINTLHVPLRCRTRMTAQVTQMAVKHIQYCTVAQSCARMDRATSTNLHSIIMNFAGKGHRLDLDFRVFSNTAASPPLCVPSDCKLQT